MDYMAAVVDGKLGKPEYRGKFNLPMYAIMNHGYRKNDSERSSLKTCFDTFKLKIVLNCNYKMRARKLRDFYEFCRNVHFKRITKI